MTKEEIKHLGRLSRIKLTDDQIDKFNGEIDAVLEYVSQINEIVADSDKEKEVGAVYNVFRADEVTNTPGEYSEDLLREAPCRQGDYVEVKKILNPED
tara:strand:- start:13897 stop:14190 length:294 start_codon:yes stop_codon:yes gene_type:complete